MNYEKLPVYVDTYELLIFVYKYTHKLERQYRYTLAEELKKALQEVMINIYKANISKDKLLAMDNAIEELARVKVLFRVLRDLHQLSIKQEARLIDKIASVSTQLKAWKKYTTNRIG